MNIYLFNFLMAKSLKYHLVLQLKLELNINVDKDIEKGDTKKLNRKKEIEREINYALNEINECLDWVDNNLNWEDIKVYAIQVPVTKIDLEKEFSDAEKWIE